MLLLLFNNSVPPVPGLYDGPIDGGTSFIGRIGGSAYIALIDGEVSIGRLSGSITLE